MKYKFGIGDQVEIIASGSGFSFESVGKIATITDQGEYGFGPGYLIEEEYDGNPKTGGFNGFVGEKSFKLYKKGIKYKKGSIVYLSFTLTRLNHFEYSKLSKFYKVNSTQICDPKNLTKGDLLYVKNNEYIMTDTNGTKERIYLVYDKHNRIYFIEESNLYKKRPLPINEIIDEIENILNNIK